MYNISIN